jgi:hypothetical protein
MAIFIGIAYFLPGLVVFSRYILVIFAFLTHFLKFDLLFLGVKSYTIRVIWQSYIQHANLFGFVCFHTSGISVTSLYCMHYCRVDHLSALIDGFQLPF